MTSTARRARLAGLIYLLASVVGIMRLGYIPKRLFVAGNAAATVDNIVAHEWLFRWAIMSELVAAVAWLFVPLALYWLLKDVDQRLAVLMVILGSVMQVPLFFVNIVPDVTALLLARGGEFLAVVDKPQRDALARLCLVLHHQLDLANAIFWGLWLIPFGLLVYRSRFLPRLLGVWLVLACFGWLAFSVTGLVFPAYESRIYKYVQPLLIGETLTIFWLVIRGANARHPLRGTEMSV